MCDYGGRSKGVYIHNLVYNLLIQLLSLQSSVFEMHFSNTFWNKAFPKGSTQNEIVRLLVIFHLPYSQCRGVKACFQLCHYQDKNFSLVLQSCHSCGTHVVPVLLVLHLCRSCCSHVAHVSTVFDTRVVKQTRSVHAERKVVSYLSVTIRFTKLR